VENFVENSVDRVWVALGTMGQKEYKDNVVVCEVRASNRTYYGD